MKARRMRIGAQISPARSFPTLRRERIRPRLILQGDWLEDAGFAPGQAVTIQQTPAGLLLTLAKA